MPHPAHIKDWKRYEAILMEAGTYEGLLDRIEDYPTTVPAKEYPSTLSNSLEAPVPKTAKAAFLVASNPHLISKPWDFFKKVYRPLLQKSLLNSPQDEKDRLRWIETLGAGHLSQHRCSWKGDTDASVHCESEGLEGYGMPALLLPELGISGNIRDVNLMGLALKQPYAERKGKLKFSSPSLYYTPLKYCRAQSELLPDESPYLVRILSIANLNYADAIQWLASQGGTVNVEDDGAVWPDVGKADGVTQHNHPDKLKVAQALMNWVFNSAYESNVEVVILHDGWTTIHFFISDNCRLVVGPTMTPRYPYPGHPEQEKLSLAQAFIALAHMASCRKKLNTAGTRVYLPGWNGVEGASPDTIESATGAKKTNAGLQKRRKRKRGN